MATNPYGDPIEDAEHFSQTRERNRLDMASDLELRRVAMELQVLAEKYRYGYQQEWCGIPVIRLPDDILVLQEIIWYLRPDFVVETGIARGGGLVLSASLMEAAQCTPRVLGLDIEIHNHASEAIRSSPFSSAIKLWEGDSASEAAVSAVTDFIRAGSSDRPGILILDSDHSHQHVLSELRQLALTLPVGSLILVADTLIADRPHGYYPNRPWNKNSNPLTAVDAFLREQPDFRRADRWCRRGLLTEFRDGVLERLSSYETDVGA